MDDIQELAKRVIIIDLGKIIYDGSLKELVEKYINYKILKITFKQSIEKSQLENYGKIIKFNHNNVTLTVIKDQVKQKTSKLLQSDLPIDDLSLQDVEAEEVVREIFTKK